MFYDKYVQLCKQRGIAETTAAQKAGISKSLVSKWKSNKTKNPSPEVLQKLSAYFRVPVSELLGEKNEKEKPTIPEDDGLLKNLSEIDMEIVKKISLLPPELKQEYASYLTYLLSKQEP